MRSLSADQVLRLHHAILERFWGDPGLRDRGLLESAVARPFAAYGGVEAHPGIHRKAAALWHALVVDHPFVDGNRPVGVAAALIFLRVNGRGLALDDERLLELSRMLTQGMTAEELAVELEQAIV